MGRSLSAAAKRCGDIGMALDDMVDVVDGKEAWRRSREASEFFGEYAANGGSLYL